MTSIRNVHSSTFKVDGYIYQVSSESVAVATSDITHACGPDLLESSAVASGSIAVSVYSVIHSSTFGILLERELTISSTAIPRSVWDPPAVGVTLDTIRSKGVARAGFDFDTNTVQSKSYAVASGSITARPVVPNIKTVQFGTLTFQWARRLNDDKIVPITDTKLAAAGISEPAAYTRIVTLVAETNDWMEHDTLMKWMNQRLVLQVYGVWYEDAYISNISDLQKRPGLTRWAYTIEFTHHVYSSSDVVTFAGISLSHPSRAAPDDISPSYAGNTGAGWSLTNLVPSVKRTWTFECITETSSEFTGLVSLIGPKNTLVINGETQTNVYISGVSKLHPRGSIGIYLYTIEFSHDSGFNPVTASFGNIPLPNAEQTGGDLEILSSRTPLASGAIAADVGTIPARSYTFTCMENTLTSYNRMYVSIGLKTYFSIDGVVMPAYGVTTPVAQGGAYAYFYISALSTPIKRGTSTVCLYTWEVTLEEATG